MAGLVGFIIPNRIQPVVLLTKSSFSVDCKRYCCIYYIYVLYQTSSLLHKNHKGLILQCTYSRQTPPLKHTPLVKGPTHEPPHRVTIFYGNSLSKSLLSPANSTGYQRKKETINLHLALLSLLPSPVPLTSRLCAVAFPFVDHLHHYHHYFLEVPSSNVCFQAPPHSPDLRNNHYHHRHHHNSHLRPTSPPQNTLCIITHTLSLAHH